MPEPFHSSLCVIVGSRTAPLEEVITDGRNGFLTDFFDTAALAAKVDEALEKRKTLDKLRERARRTVIEKYYLKRVCLPRHLKLLGISAKKQKA